MKHMYLSIVLLLFVRTMSSKSYSLDTFSVLEGPYIG